MDDTDTQTESVPIQLTAQIVAAYISNNHVPPTELPFLISGIFEALGRTARAAEPAVPAPQLPAVPVKKSVTDDHLICLEDGKKFKSLKRHLMTQYGLTPDDYRQKWGLGSEYPMVAPNYAAARSLLAKQMGLGRKGAEAVSEPAPVIEAAKAPKRSRGKKPAAVESPVAEKPTRGRKAKASA